MFIKKMAPVTSASHSADISNEVSSPSREKSRRAPASRSLKRESKRLKTFVNWPVSFLDSKNLAKNGFYFTKIDDVIKCAFCKIQIGFWEEGDDPIRDHQSFAPECPFLKNEPCGNVPLSEDNGEDDPEEDEPVSQDVCGIYAQELRPFSEPERSNKGTFSVDLTNLWKDFEELGVLKICGPVAPNYATYASRLKSFDKWKPNNCQSPESLAEAGFYYIGLDDNVVCFHCGGGLKNWKKDDDPWVEHARWFSKCRFVLLQKGTAFINEVVLKKKAYLTAETAREIISRSRRHSDETADPSEEVSVQRTDADPLKKNDESASTCGSSPASSPTLSLNGQMQSSNGKDIQLCVICYTRERGIVFLPCGHFVCCPQCTTSLNKCAVCREPFKATVRAYFC